VAVNALVLDATAFVDPRAPEPARGPGEALVAVRLAGICDTDLQLARGVRRVATACRWTLRLDALLHVLGILGRGGALAERLVLPERCLVEVPANLPDDRAVFAEPLAAALHVLDELGGAESAVVLGDGKLGLLIALALHGHGVPTTLVGHHAHKLALAAAAGVRVSLEDALPPGPQAPLVVEASGSEAGLSRALSLVAPRGTLVLKTTLAGRLNVDLAPVVIHELRVVGSRCGDIGRAVATLAAGRVDPTPLIEARYPLDEADRALAHAGRRGALKVLVHVPG
jgi:threonine dehydrogenase-like Zn-dependent dehydrogenase